MPANQNVIDTTKPAAVAPDTANKPVLEPIIQVEVQDRLLRELKRRLFPNDVEGILYSAIVGDLYWQDQLWSLMVDTWPRLQTNLEKLKRAVSSMEYVVTPFVHAADELPTESAVEKAGFCETALFGMHGNRAWQQHDFAETLEDIVDSIVAGFTVMEIYWENRDGGIVPECSRWLPARYYRFPYVLDDYDRLMLNPSGMLGGTQLVDFPPYKFLVCIKQSHANHPVFTAPMRTLTAWWIASRFGLEWFMSYAQLFGIPRRIAYYTPGDQVVYQQLVQMMRQSAAATWGVFPKGTQVEDQAAAGSSGGHMPQERLIEEADKVCDIMLLGQTLTTEVRESGSRALGQVHRTVMDEILEAAAKYCAKAITNQIIPGIIRYNFGDLDELPTLEPVIKSPKDLLQLAQSYNILFNQMRIPVRKDELYDRIEFTAPDDDSELYEPPPAPAPIAPFLGGKPNIEGAPEDEGVGAPGHAAPSGRSVEPTNGEKLNIVERVGASNGSDPDDEDDPDDDWSPARKVSFALDYGEEPEPGETLRFLEAARHEQRHPKTGRFVPALKAAKRKVAKKKEPVPEVGLICKRNEDMGDDKVCQACKDISAEGWIPVDEEFLGYSMNPPHHPNCRCDVDYKTRYRGVDIHHMTKSGNPRHHPETGRFVSKR